MEYSPYDGERAELVDLDPADDPTRPTFPGDDDLGEWSEKVEHAAPGLRLFSTGDTWAVLIRRPSLWDAVVTRPGEAALTSVLTPEEVAPFLRSIAR